MRRRDSNPERVEITTCHGCPFCADNGESILDDDWACTALDGPDGYRKLTKRVVMDGNDRWLPPPKFCPLRRADHLVTLRKP